VIGESYGGSGVGSSYSGGGRLDRRRQIGEEAVDRRGGSMQATAV